MTLSEYLGILGNLNVNKCGKRIAPHKAILLLAISDLIESNIITTPLIPLDEKLSNAFNSRWKLHVTKNSGFHCKLSYPFYHLASSDFWELIPKKSVERKVLKEYSSLSSLKRDYVGANIDAELFNLLLDSESRKRIRKFLISTYLNDNSASPFLIASEALSLLYITFSAVNF